MALYQPRRAVIATVLANLLQAEFAEGSSTIAIIFFSLSLFLAKFTVRAEPLLSLSFIHGKNRLCTNLVHPLKSP